MKRLIVFDLDGTLAESKSALDTEMAALLAGLLAVVKVAIISGGAWAQFEKQILPFLPPEARLADLSLLPTCGTTFFQYGQGADAGGWTALYADNLSPEEKAEITNALKQALKQSGLSPDRLWGEQIEDRGGQITFSALGQEAPLDAKQAWDPDYSKRKALRARLLASLPRFSVQIGGSTSIDVTRPSIDKAYGIGRLAEALAISVAEMIYIGDALFPGGNDFAARRTGVACVPVANPHETRRVIEAITACLAPELPASLPPGP
jgi:HAD superfamily hydrolase (TIGR01484 family)